MRVTEFLNLDEMAVSEAIHEVVETIRQDSPGRDHLRAALPGSPTHRLLWILLQRVRDRTQEYGAEAGISHGLMMAFRIGAAYGRRILAPRQGGN